MCCMLGVQLCDTPEQLGAILGLCFCLLILPLRLRRLRVVGVARRLHAARGVCVCGGGVAWSASCVSRGGGYCCC